MLLVWKTLVYLHCRLLYEIIADRYKLLLSIRPTVKKSFKSYKYLAKTCYNPFFLTHIVRRCN